MPDAGATDQARRVGRFNDTDGAFFELLGTDLRAVTRYDSVDTAVDRIAWSHDRVDGTGALATYDATDEHVYEISITPMRVEFYLDGVLVHVANRAAQPGGTVLREPRLPVGIEIVNTGVTTAGSIFYAEVVLVDDQDPAEVYPIGYAVRHTVPVAPGTHFILRPAPTDFSGVVNRVSIVPHRLRIVPVTGTLLVAAYRVFGSSDFYSPNPTIFDLRTNAIVGFDAPLADLEAAGPKPFFRALVSSSMPLDLDLRDCIAPLALREFTSGVSAAAFPAEQMIVHIYPPSGGPHDFDLSVSWHEE